MEQDRMNPFRTKNRLDNFCSRPGLFHPKLISETQTQLDGWLLPGTNQQDIGVSLIRRGKSGQSDTARLLDPDSSSQVDTRNRLDKVPDWPSQILDNNFQRDRFYMQVHLLHPLMVNIFPAGILVGILIHICSNDQLDIWYSTSYHQHQLVNYTFQPDTLFIWLSERTTLVRVIWLVDRPLSPDL